MPSWRPLRNAISPRAALAIALWPVCGQITINDFFFEITPINGPSMSPTLSNSCHETGARDYVLWKKWFPTNDLKRGDVVLYDGPRDPEVRAVKRVIALAGDTVILDRRRRPGYNANGEENELERVAKRNWDNLRGRVVVPWGHVWVEGDNWRSSFDSNHFGPVSRSLIVGKAVQLFWPLGSFGNRPWESGFRGRTKVLEGKGDVPGEWEDMVARGMVTW